MATHRATGKPRGRPKGCANPHAGRKAIAVGGRAWARSIADDPKVRAMLAAAALENPDIALKIFEHGYGRPPQALDVRTGGTLKVEFGLPSVDPAVGLDDPE